MGRGGLRDWMDQNPSQALSKKVYSWALFTLVLAMMMTFLMVSVLLMGEKTLAVSARVPSKPTSHPPISVSFILKDGERVLGEE